VVTSFPLGEVVCNPDATGRIAKWSLELMGQGITYAPRIAIKSQALADFVAEWTETQLPPAPLDEEYWTMFFDGSLMKKGAGIGLMFISPLGVRMRYVVRIHFPALTMLGSTRPSSTVYASPSNWASDASRCEETRASSWIK
jgi:hypothetical protein